MHLLSARYWNMEENIQQSHFTDQTRNLTKKLRTLLRHILAISILLPTLHTSVLFLLYMCMLAKSDFWRYSLRCYSFWLSLRFRLQLRRPRRHPTKAREAESDNEPTRLESERPKQEDVSLPM